MSRRNWIWMTLPIVATLVLTYPWWIRAALVFLDDVPHNGHAQAYFKQMQVHREYKVIDFGTEGTCKCNLVYDFIGPSDVDAAHVFTGPNLTVESWPAESVGDTGLWEFLLRGTGQSGGSGECRVYVNRFQREYDPFDSWNVSSKQRHDFKAGKLAILELEISCTADGGW